MSNKRDNLLVLYIGAQDHALAIKTALDAHDWFVYVPEDMMEALADVVIYYPDVIVFDAAYPADFAASVYSHLMDIQASPMVLLSNGEQPTWTTGFDDVLPADLSTDELMAALWQLWVDSRQNVATVAATSQPVELMD